MVVVPPLFNREKKPTPTKKSPYTWSGKGKKKTKWENCGNYRDKWCRGRMSLGWWESNSKKNYE